MTLPTVTVVGRLTGDPELRFTPSGAAVANFTIAANDRRKQGDEWVDGPTTFLRCSVWREAAENVADSLIKGTEVIVVGRLTQRGWETKEGEKRTALELAVDAIGPSLRYASAKVTKAQRGGGVPAQTDPWARPATDPWATSTPTDEPPF